MSHTLAAEAARLAGMVCRHLGWRPADFWAATPAEIAAICASEAADGTPALSRNELEHLMEQDRDGR